MLITLNFSGIGASSFPCSGTYAGSAPFSEPESLAVKDFIDKETVKMDVFITTHSYGQLILLPYGYTKKLPRNYTQLVSRNLLTKNIMYYNNKSRHIILSPNTYPSYKTGRYSSYHT